MDYINGVINSAINEIIRQQRERTEKSLAEVVTKYDFAVCSKECMHMLEEAALPEGTNIAYTPYIEDPDAIYAIKRFSIRDLLNEALKEKDAAGKEEK